MSRWHVSLRADGTAGLTTAAVVVPQSMAYATIAGLPVQTGLYAALVPMAVYAVLGTSRPLSVSTTSAVAALTATALATTNPGDDPVAAVGAAVTLALLTGAVLVVAGLARLGGVADLISLPVLVGFKTGTGLVIVVGQLGGALGVDVSGGGFFQRTWSALDHLTDLDPATTTLSVATVVGLIVARRTAPRLPAPLLAVGLGIVAVSVLGLGDDGVARVGPVPTGLPSAELPALERSGTLLGPAVAIALMAFVESSSAARTFRRADDPMVVVDRELVALGAANLAGSVFSAMPAAGGLSQTAVNDRAGARSQVSSMVTVVAVILTLTALAPLFDNLAQATLSAVVIVAASGLVDVRALRRMTTVRWEEPAVAVLAVLGVLVWGTVAGVAIGVALSYLLLLRMLGRPPIFVQTPPEGRWCALGGEPPQLRPGLVVARVELPVYWASARQVVEQMVAAIDTSSDQARVLLLDWTNQPRPGSSLQAAWGDLDRQLQHRAVALWIAGAGGGVAPAAQGGIRHFPSVTEATAAYER